MLHQSKIAKESLLSCRTTGVNGVGMFARQQVIAHPVYCALTALTQEATTDRVEVTRQPVSSWVSDHQRIPTVVWFFFFFFFFFLNSPTTVTLEKSRCLR